MLDRDLAQRVGRRDAPGAACRGEDGELRDQDAHAERRHERDDRVRRRERRSDLAAIGEDVHDEVRERAARDQAERAGDQRHEQRFAGDQPADLRRGRAECAQHGGLPPALGDGERERPGHDEQRDGAGDAAQRAEDGDEAGTIRSGRVAGVGIGRVPAIEDLDPAPEALLQATAQYGGGGPGLGDHADGVDLPGSAGQCGGDGGCEEHRGLALVARAAGVGEPADAVARVTGGRDDPQHRADVRAQPDVGDHVARPAGRASGGEAIRRERRAVPAVADRAGPRARRRSRRPRRSRHRPGTRCRRRRGRRRDGRDALDRRAGSRGPGMTSTPSASSPRPMVTVGSARTTASAAARRPAPGGPSARRHQQSGGGGEGDGEPDGDERAGERGAAGAQRLQ